MDTPDSWTVLACCTGCGLCVEVCPHNALVLIDARPERVQPDVCDACGKCEEVCPEGALDCEFTIVWEDQASEGEQWTSDGGENA